MKITKIKTTPLLVPYSKPYYWAQGVIEGHVSFSLKYIRIAAS
jgi:hypothetical protein